MDSNSIQGYLERFHEDDIRIVVGSSFVYKVPFKSVQVDITHLKETNSDLYDRFMANIWLEREQWIQQTNMLQKKYMESMDQRTANVKPDFPVNFFNAPNTKGAKEFELDEHKLWKPVQVSGKVIRTGSRVKEELYREYKCRKCKHSVIVEASRYERFYFRAPLKCATPFCKGAMNSDEDEENLDYYIDFQRIKIQTVKIGSLPVELECELVESCFVGEQVNIFGTFETRSRHGDITSHEYTLRAMSVIVPENQKKLSKDMAELTFVVRDDWTNELEALGGVEKELQLRDEMVKSVAPELRGLATMKLSLLLLLVSGGKSTASSKGTNSKTIREIVHMLLIGDPGLGKSQLLKAASLISANSVRCIGYAATTAGLTAQYFRENNETHIEAGALVKANNGVCCIDEINFMSKEHRGSIHEVMEQQKITMMKAGMTAEIPTKVSIVAGMNKKNSSLPVETSNMNIEGSLLSRFDIIFEMQDPRDPVADAEVIWHILNELSFAQPSWSLERLKDHVMVAKEIAAKMSVPAEKVLRQYYLFCQAQPAIDQTRNTIRLWNALNRMTLCHAKLLLRNQVQLVDALTVVMLMENTWSMGHLGLKQPDAMRSVYPLGPSKQIALEILEKLELEHLLDEVVVESPPKTRRSQSQYKHETTLDDIDSIFEDEKSEYSGSQFPSSQKESETESFIQTAQESQVKDVLTEVKKRNSDSVASTSTQQTTQSPVKAVTQNRKSSLYNFFSQAKRAKLTPTVQPESDAQDSLYASLNTLAGNLLQQSSPQPDKLPPKLDDQPTKSVLDKLKKFQYVEGSEATSSAEHKENVQSAETLPPDEEEDDGLEGFENFELW